MSEHRRKPPVPTSSNRVAARRNGHDAAGRMAAATTSRIFLEAAPEIATSASSVTEKPRSRFKPYAGRTAMAGVLLPASGAAVFHEEPSKQHAIPVAESAVPHAVYRTGGEGLWLHDGPGLEAPLMGTMPDGMQFNVDCFVLDDPVNGNPVWLEGTSADGRHGSASDYYIDTHWDTTQDLVNQGIEQCGMNPNPPGLQNRAPQQPARPNPIENGGSVFYAPGNGDQVAGFGNFNSVATITMSNQGGEGLDWSQGQEYECNPQAADDFPEVVSNFSGIDKRITTLGGWSIGRLGPAYFLQETAKEGASQDAKRKRDNVNYIVLFDPGSKTNYEGDCDQSANQSVEMAKWLREDPNNHLVIFAGEVTRDKDSASGRFEHQGIQETLFAPAIRGHSEITDQVVVCNYDLDHKATYTALKTYINKPPITNPGLCPINAAGWRP